VVESYKENEFKEETKIGRIPKDWKIVKLKDIILEAKPGFACGKRDENGIIQLRMDSIRTDGRIDPTAYVKVPPPKDVEEYLLRPGDILFNNTNSRDLVGKTAIFRGEHEKCVFSNHLTRIRVRRSIVIPEWILYNFIRMWRFGMFKVLCHPHVHQAGINKKDLLNLAIPLPPLEEQELIAGILYSIDEAIRAVDASIAEYEQLKKGLMQELLTKGIGHKEFKETEIGRIPASWKMVKLGEKGVATIRGGKANKPHGYEKVAFIPMEKIPDNGLYAEFEMRPISDVKSFVYCEAGDVLLAKITPCFENGKQGIVPEDIPNGFALATTEVFPIICKGVNRFFLFYLLKMPKFRNLLKSAMRGTTGRLRVPRDAVTNLKIPLPPPDEQERIAKIILSADTILEEKRRKKAKLERIKKATMDILLTGKVRVRA